MPIYEFDCQRCKTRFEEVRPMSEAGKPTKCPGCGVKATQAVSRFGISGTDSLFWAGPGFKRKPDIVDKIIRKRAARLGISTEGKTYYSQLARKTRYGFDPEAFVSNRGDIKRVCEERGYACDGAVTVKGREFEEPPDCPLAPDLIEEAVDDMLAKDPGLAIKKREELREMAFDRHKDPRSKEPMPKAKPRKGRRRNAKQRTR